MAALVGTVTVTLGVAGCTSSTTVSPTTSTLGVSPTVHLTPVQESESWFKAVNMKDSAASLAHFNPQNRDQADWNNGDVTQWPTFSNVSCSPSQIEATTAIVHCAFQSHGDPSSANDTFWNVEFHRTPGGPWLITNYGQG